MAGPQLTTAVIGAGPAGLLFTVAGRLLHARAGRDPREWALRLYDKRDEYVRTHRLRIAPEPYEALARDLGDPRFDALLAFLHEEGFRPEVNRLEAKLGALARELGVEKERVEIGARGRSGEGTTTLAELRERLAGEGLIAEGTRFTIVAADSVHSSVRELVRGDAAPEGHVHQRVARLRVVGPGLPASLDPVTQVRLSKVIGSVVDYRLNQNGFAEVDLFLEPGDHAPLEGLRASPKEPRSLEARTLSRLRAPLLRRIVERLQRGFGAGPCEVLLASSFVLEHRVMPRLVFERPELPATVFLVGDAAISLPYFRGMAALGSAAHALAHAHVDLAIRAARENDEGLQEATRAEIDRHFRAPGRPTRFGAWFLPGEVIDVRATVHHGRPAFAVLHRFAGRWGAHLLEPEDADWIAHHHLAPVGRAAAERAFAAWADPARRYEDEVRALARRELAVVRARGRLVALLRELARVSAILPFPIQSWWLATPDERPDARASRPAVALNAMLAVVAALLALGGPALSAAGIDGAAWIALAALPVQALGGAAYHAVVTLHRGPVRPVQAVWRAQTLVLFLVGVPLAARAAQTDGALLSGALPLALAWLVLAAMFVVGLYAYERVVARWLGRAEL